MDGITHYACMGSCHGTSANPGVCETDGCTHKGAELVPCDCTDGMHHRAA